MIELRNVSKTFNPGRPNAFTAVRGVSAALEPGRITVFRGPSGSGKTTILTLIGCMARPTEGRIFIEGTEVTSLPEPFLAKIRRSRFGFIFQSFNLIEGMSVLENILLPAFPLGLPYREMSGRARELLGRFRLEDKANRLPETLSGGEKQRVAIARALMNNPGILIADEPTAQLDSELSHEFMEIAQELNGEGMTLLIASHDPLVFEAPGVHRVLSVRDGAIVAGE